jgi:hypothetical protein
MAWLVLPGTSDYEVHPAGWSQPFKALCVASPVLHPDLSVLVPEDLGGERLAERVVAALNFVEDYCRTHGHDMEETPSAYSCRRCRRRLGEGVGTRARATKAIAARRPTHRGGEPAPSSSRQADEQDVRERVASHGADGKAEP